MAIDSKKLLIENSHKRSESYGVEKKSNYSKKILSGEELENILNDNKELIEVSQIYIDMVFSAVMDNEFIIVLTDKSGCILYIKGAEENSSKLDVDNLNVGAYMDEQNIGTNAMGTAIKEDKCIQVTANEHYIEGLQSLTCSAAPIHSTNGEIIGTLNLTVEGLLEIILLFVITLIIAALSPIISLKVKKAPVEFFTSFSSFSLLMVTTIPIIFSLCLIPLKTNLVLYLLVCLNFTSLIIVLFSLFNSPNIFPKSGKI